MNLTIWLDAELGFFHIVQQDRNQYQVRAHRLEGIREIRALAQVESEIIETPDSTFHYGLNLAPEQLLHLMARLTQVAALTASPSVSAPTVMPVPPLAAPMPRPAQPQTLAPAARARLQVQSPYAAPASALSVAHA